MSDGAAILMINLEKVQRDVSLDSYNRELGYGAWEKSNKDLVELYRTSEDGAVCYARCKDQNWGVSSVANNFIVFLSNCVSPLTNKNFKTLMVLNG